MTDPNHAKLVECTIPVLPVTNLIKSRAYYLETLGFSLDWGDRDDSLICSVSRDDSPVMLAQGLAGRPPQWVWIGVEDERLFAEWKKAGVKVKQEPMNWSWAYEMKFEDPDRNVLWVGTESRKDLPLVDS